MNDPGGAIYLDHNASTPMTSRVLEVFVRAAREGFGNPSADHPHGRRARAFVSDARAQVAALLRCEPDEVIFTGGGTEANNLAIVGWARAANAPVTVVTTAVEHPATLGPAGLLSRGGAALTRARVLPSGCVDPGAIEAALPESGPSLVTVILAQNETGVIQPIAEIARRARARGAVVHTDGAQAVGKIPVDVGALGVDMLSIAGHKLYAPKGVGALFVRRGTPIGPVVLGAGHERGLRPGTENVAGIAALGEACAMASEDLAIEASRQERLRDRLAARLAAGGFVVHGEGAPRLPNTLNGRFPWVRGSALLAALPEIAFTTGSACHSGAETPSAILTAMGIAPEAALGAVRLTLGRDTTEAEIERAADRLLDATARARETREKS